MFSLVIKFLLSIILFNWIYAEVVNFVPEVGSVVDTVTQVCAIPTHDQWPSDLSQINAENPMGSLVQSATAGERKIRSYIRGLSGSGSTMSSKGSLFDLFGPGRSPSTNRMARRVSSVFEEF